MWIDQILIIGEGREFLTALVVPNLEALHAFAAEHGVDHEDDEALLREPKVRELFEQEFRTYSKNAAAHEKIRDFRLVAAGFTVDNDLMTPTMKLKRRRIEQQYAPLVDEMYESFAER